LARSERKSGGRYLKDGSSPSFEPTTIRFSTPQLSGLRAIADLPRLTRRILVYLGDRRLKTEDGIEVWPLDALLAAVAGNTLWP